MSPSPTTRVAPLVAAALIAVGLTGCGNQDDKKLAPEVAAKVGAEEISVQQINQVLSRTNSASATPAAVQALRREVLEKLIDQQLAVDQATENKLHRAPEVAAQIEAARREVMARAYIQQVTAALPKPTPEEARKYFNDHPQLFSERRVYSLQEIVVPANAGAIVAEQLRAQVAAGNSMEDMAAFLKSRDVKFGGGAATRAAEQIPLELLAKVHALKDGQTTVIDSAQGYTVLRVVSSQSAPVPETNALPRIEQFLLNQRGAEAVSKSIKELRAKASITYVGDFAQTKGSAGNSAAGQPAPSGSAVAAAPDVPAVPIVPAAPAPGASAPDPTAKIAVEKGGAGLK